jgi:hypothetical protein
MNTAVDKLIHELNLIERIQINGKYVIQIELSKLDGILDQAKEMEKEQKKELVIGTYIDLKIKNNKLPYGLEYLNKLAKVDEEAKQYYNETFKQKQEHEDILCTCSKGKGIDFDEMGVAYCVSCQKQIN